MAVLRYLTAGETHGKALTAIIEGMPAGISVSKEKIDEMLAKRQKGYGRGGRMQIEHDQAEILSGVRGGISLGSPISLQIQNRDFENWAHIMGAETAAPERVVDCPRPGHADLTGGMKYNHRDFRNVLERASARETAARVAVGAVAEALLEQFGISVDSRVVRIGEVCDKADPAEHDFFERVAKSPVSFGDLESEKLAMEQIDRARTAGESLGGVVEVIIRNVPPGLGSYVHYDRKLDAQLAMTLMSIQAIKGVEIGTGFRQSEQLGSSVHDEIGYRDRFYRMTNHAGGIEGGMSNGEPIILRAAMKPIPTLYHPLRTVKLSDKSETKASVERSDVCAVSACAIVAESAAAFEIAKAFLEKFSGDCLEDLKMSYQGYMDRIRNF